jgi:hypothetical protein
MPGDDFETIVERLYAGPPDQFIADRNSTAKRVRADGDKELAKRVQELRRPTVAAALVNRLGRGAGHAHLEQLLELGARLREAQRSLDTKAMKTLSSERNSLINELLAAVEEESGDALSTTVREQLSDTFTAAIADADAGRAVTSGRLVSGLRYSGFGEVELGDAVAIPLEPEAENTDAVPDTQEQAGAERRRARQESAAAELEQARARLEAARNAEAAAAAAVELAEHGLAAARRTAANARKRAAGATTTREAAEKTVAAAEEATATAEGRTVTS